ncbi:hypothetical protein AB6A40_000506 [Gnathostoma spinigerum]|uniref:Uncharacterized protein n=1 Tax=Gnathostoma spinigerum TaxID=75299 RepID=A0ABD6E4B3_9BILA
MNTICWFSNFNGQCVNTVQIFVYHKNVIWQSPQQIEMSMTFAVRNTSTFQTTLLRINFLFTPFHYCLRSSAPHIMSQFLWVSIVENFAAVKAVIAFKIDHRRKKADEEISAFFKISTVHSSADRYRNNMMSCETNDHP